MQSFFEFFAGVDSVLSVLAAIAAVLLFGLRSHVCFEISLSPWQDPTLMGIYVSGRSRARNVDLCFRAVGIGGKLRLVPDACEDISREVIRPVELQRSVRLLMQLSGEGTSCAPESWPRDRSSHSTLLSRSEKSSAMPQKSGSNARRHTKTTTRGPSKSSIIPETPSAFPGTSSS